MKKKIDACFDPINNTSVMCPAWLQAASQAEPRCFWRLWDFIVIHFLRILHGKATAWPGSVLSDFQAGLYVSATSSVIEARLEGRSLD